MSKKPLGHLTSVFLSILVGLVLVASPIAAGGRSARLAGPVVVVNFDIEVDPGSSALMQRALSVAQGSGASAILIEMNTPGGLLSDMTSIVSTIADANQSGISVYTYVPPNGLAASAGSYIAMASNRILMGDGSAIGPSTPIVVGGSPLEQNHTEAAMLKLLVGLAEKWGRNQTAAANMVLQDEAFTAGEAIKYHVADGRANSLTDALGVVGLSGSEQIVVGESLYEQFISALSNPILDGILILVGIIAIVIDIQHGSIILTVIGAAAILAGLVGAEVINASILGFFVLALAGVLIILELKLGHGFSVMAGVILGAAGIVYLASGLSYSPSPITPLTEVALVAVVAFGILLGIYFRWVLGPIRQKKKETGPEALVGQKGITVTDLSPSGEIRVTGILWGAEAESGSIPSGRRVVVKGVKGLSLIVEEDKSASP